VIEKRVTLPCDVATAFALFTERIGEWWPPERRHTGDPNSRIVLSQSGRFFERASDGREVELGVVREFDAPRRLLLDWYPGTGPEQPTRVEILFTQSGDETVIDVRHSETEASKALFPSRAPRYDASWDLVFSTLLRTARGFDR
jgi:uncharacterized protein YndB with AHSA1/START domain